MEIEVPRQAKPLPINLGNITQSVLMGRNAHRKDTLLFLQTLMAIEDAAGKDEISPFVAAMHSLKFLIQYKDSETFSPESYLACAEKSGGGVITVPVAWINALLEAWELYIDPETSVPFEKAAGLSGDGGGRKASTKINELTEYYYLARLVFEEKLSALSQGELLSDDNAFTAVEISLEDIPEYSPSAGKIRDAWKRWGPMYKQLAALMSADRP